MAGNFNNLFNGLVKALTPPPLALDPVYDGAEYRWKFLVFRPEFLKTQLRFEFFILGAVIFYVSFIFYGKSSNSKRANKWFEAHLPIFKEQFSSPTNDGLIADGYSDFFNFSTGRRGVVSLHTVFTLRPRHDFVQMIFQFLWGLQDLRYRPRDELELDLKLAPDIGVPDFVFAVVSKEELAVIRDSRWDLTFTKTTENSNIPSSLSVMSEIADVTEQLFKPLDKFSLVDVLSNPVILPYFRSLSVTDQPRERPRLPIPFSEREKHIILSLSVPPPSRAADTLPLVTALFAFVDTLPKVSLRPETKAKVKKTREEVDKEIKEDSEKDKKDEAAAERLTAKKKAEDERLSKLSAAEQKKALERDRKRAIKKQQGKVVRK